MTDRGAQLVVALDIDSMAELRELMDQLSDCVEIFKVGSQLFTACGPAAVRYVQARGKKVFLDLKFHDIPNTVAQAVSNVVCLSEAIDRSLRLAQAAHKKSTGLFMFTVHTSGGEKMMVEAVSAGTKAAEKIGVKRPLIVGVTVLTSEEKTDNIQALVLERASLAKQSGLDGVVASCHEAQMLRKEFGPDFVIVTPGIRPQGSDNQDQQRVATPQYAMQSGSNYLIVGRPIVNDSNPAQAAQKILDQMRNK